MMRGRWYSKWSVLVVAVVAAACGGGGSGSTGGTGGFATLKGTVTEVNGQTADLGGVLLFLQETGASTATGADGSFSFGLVPTGSVNLQVTGGGVTVLKNGADDGANQGDAPGDDNGNDGTEPGDDNGNDGTEPGDDNGGDRPDGSSDDGASEDGSSDDDSPDDDEVEDGDDLNDDNVEVHRIQNGEQIEVKLRVRDGKIESVECSRSSDDERGTEIRMARTDANDDADMTGKVEVEVRSDRERFDVEVEHAAPGRSLETVVIDGAGNEESIGVRTVNTFGEAEWEIRTNDGGRLPFGVASVADLEGFRVEVRDGATDVVLLTAEIPGVPTSVGTPAGSRERGRSDLRATEPGLEGYVEVRSRPEDARERFQVEAEHLAAGRVVEVWLENPATPGTLDRIATIAANAGGEAELELDTGDGASLPFGVAAVADLAGLAVEVRDAGTGALLLSGIVPDAVPE